MLIPKLDPNLDTTKLNCLQRRQRFPAKLAEIKAQKKRAKELRGGGGERKEEREEKEQQEVVIEWRHMEGSLRSTRASISVDERRRLEMIYREFVVGRNGEMRSGEGNREVGGRVSLM